MMKKAPLVLVAAAFAALGTGCDRDAPGGSAAAATISIEPGTLALDPGGRGQLRASFSEGGGGGDAPISWSSSNSSIAQVSSLGEVTAVSPGATQIRAIHSGRSAIAEITVRGEAPTPAAGSAATARPPVASPDGAIAGSAAAGQIGETRTVCDRVAQTIAPLASGTGPALVVFGDQYPYQSFAIVIPDASRRAFREAHGEDPEILLRDRRVCAEGRIATGTGSVQGPQITIDNLAQLTW